MSKCEICKINGLSNCQSNDRNRDGGWMRSVKHVERNKKQEEALKNIHVQVRISGTVSVDEEGRFGMRIGGCGNDFYLMKEVLESASHRNAAFYEMTNAITEKITGILRGQLVQALCKGLADAHQDAVDSDLLFCQIDDPGRTIIRKKIDYNIKIEI